MSIGTWLLKEFELISFIEISAKTFQNQSKWKAWLEKLAMCVGKVLGKL
jgi:hypothetical protein